MELLSSIMLLILYVAGRLMIWHEVGGTESKKPVKLRRNSFSPATQFDIRCCSSIGKRV